MAVLRHVWTGYCGSCIKVCSENWGRGTKKVKPFAHTRVSNWFIISLDSSASGLVTTWQRTLLQTGSAKYELGHYHRGIYHHHLLTGWVFSKNVAKLQTCTTSTHWRGCIFQEGNVLTDMYHMVGVLLILILCSAIASSFSQGDQVPTPILGSRLFPNSSSGRCAWLHGG